MDSVTIDNKAPSVLANQVVQEGENSAQIQAVNTTMQTEIKSDHWPTYTWRPFVGYCFGILGLLSGILVFAAYLGVMFFQMPASLLGSLPGLVGAQAGVMAMMAPVLGIASYWRGKMQADPRIPTDMRG